MYLSRFSCASEYHAAKARMKIIGDLPRPGYDRGPAKPIEILNTIKIRDVQCIAVAHRTVVSEPSQKNVLGRHNLEAFVVDISRFMGKAKDCKTVIKGGRSPAIRGYVEIDGVQARLLRKQGDCALMGI